MYLGRIVEEGPAEAIFNEPRHPYTEALLDAIPAPDPVHQRTRDRIVLDRRDSVSREPALGMSLPHPLPVRVRHLP